MSVCGAPLALGASPSFLTSSANASRNSGRLSSVLGFSHQVVSLMSFAYSQSVSFALSPRRAPSGSPLTRDVQIRQLHRAEVSPEPAGLLCDVVGNELAVHALKGSVQAGLDIQVLLVLAHRLLALLLDASILRGPPLLCCPLRWHFG